MLNLDALKALSPALTAGSNEKADPAQLFQMVKPLLVQVVEGIAHPAKSSGATLATYVGQDYEAVSRQLKKSNVNLSRQTVEANWPLEVWTLSQLLLPLISFDSNVVAYTTSDGKILGFGAAVAVERTSDTATPSKPRTR